MRRFAVLSVIAGLLVSPAIMPSERAEAHPLHTSLAELAYDTGTGAVQLSLRVFVDDFSRAAIAFQKKHGGVKSASAGPAQSPLIGYAIASFVLTDARGRRVAFTSCGGKRVGDLMWLCFKGQSSGPLRVVSEVLFDTYRDQINIVRASSAGKTTNLLFTPGESAKLIR